ncbi:MAG: hypothetical protein U0790_05315 [Isosphaeraceae bacterium]
MTFWNKRLSACASGRSRDRGVAIEVEESNRAACCRPLSPASSSSTVATICITGVAQLLKALARAGVVIAS